MSQEVCDLAIRGMPLVPSMVTKTLICIDEMVEHELTGRILNPYIKEVVPFTNSMQILGIMENYFDKISFPQAYFADRRFEYQKRGNSRKLKPEIIRYHPDEILTENKGKLATLVLAVQFRQSAEWQGTLEWLEGGNQERKFGSTLDIIRMLDQAVEQGLGRPVHETWK